MKWNTVDCMNLIAAYQQNPILWNRQHTSYNDKEKKRDVWISLGRLFDCSARDVRKKMDNLLRTYRQERARVVKPSPSDNGTHQGYESRWYAYKRMSFLDDKPEVGNLQNSRTITHDSSKCDDTQMTEGSEQESLNEALWAVEAVYHPEVTISDGPDHGARPDLTQGLKRRAENGNGVKTSDQWTPSDVSGPKAQSAPKIAKSLALVNFEEPKNNVEGLNSIGSKNQSHVDNCAIYGQHIGNKLRDYDKRTKAVVEYQINNILFKADMGQYESLVIERSHLCGSHKLNKYY